MNEGSILKVYRLVIWLIPFIAVSLFAQEIQVEPSFDTERWLRHTETINFKTDTVLQAEEGKLAMILGATDLTDLFKSFGDSLVYSPTFMSLPSGESEIIFYLVSPDNEWQEINRFTLKVKTTTGFQKASITGNVSLNNNGQIAEGHAPFDNRPDKSTYQELNGSGRISSEHIRDAFSVRSQWDFVGAYDQEQALRFGEKGKDAARIDLSSYQINLQDTWIEFSMGHISHGRNQHLINSFGSRGTMVKFNPIEAIDFSLAILNAQSIVGWDNFTGITRKNNRIYSSTLGVDVFERQGALRVEGSLMNGSSLPLDNFNQGSVNDAEKSHGYGLNLQASAPNDRIRFEGGFARSKFENPDDPLLSGDFDIVPVEDETKGARFARLNVGLLQNYTLLPNWQTSFNLNLNHERVDPLYRSLAASAQADFLQNAIALQGNVGAISMQFSHNRSEDNLDDIESILKTKTRANTFALAVPFQALLIKHAELMPLLPMFSFNMARTHQFGDELPVNGGFSDGHVPDQVSSQRGANLDWTGNNWRLGYRIGYSNQDNRQPGRENADFENINHGVSLGLNPGRSIDLSFDVAFEKARSKAEERTDKTTNFSVGFSMPTSERANLGLNLTTTHSSDNQATTFNDNVSLNAQWSYGFGYNLNPNKTLLNGQFFIRYNRTAMMMEDRIFGFNNEFMNWTINTGVNVSLF